MELSWIKLLGQVIMLFGSILFEDGGVQKKSESEQEIENFLTNVNNKMSEQCNEVAVATWLFNTNITDENERNLIATQSNFVEFSSEINLGFNKLDLSTVTNKTTERMLTLMMAPGLDIESPNRRDRFHEVVVKMTDIHSSTMLCLSEETGHPCNFMENYENPTDRSKTLLNIWENFHNTIGRNIKPLFKEYVQLSREGSHTNGLGDYGELWRSVYNAADLETSLANHWKDLRPFYQQLHAYVRKKYSEEYGEKIVSRKGVIPAHLTGLSTTYVSDWTDTTEFTKSNIIPFPQDDTHVDLVLKRKVSSVTQMAKIAEEFFISIGFPELPESFWKYSIFTHPTDGRKTVCHPTAIDMCSGDDFRIIMCATVSLNNFQTIHHEMGHIYYFMTYSHLPFVFREGANPAFHEAIGDVIGLSVLNPTHLKNIGLFHQLNVTRENNINFLLHLALDKIAALPFGYIVDLWRWKIFRGDIPEDKWNDEWWQLRKEYEGIFTTSKRSEEDFDASTIPHVVSDTPFIRYFIAAILQFQIHKSLCITANQYEPDNPLKPLHLCDIYNSKAAGNKLIKAMKLGMSKPWPDVLEVLTGQRNLDTKPLLEYFSPLIEFLEEDNKKTDDVPGWS